MKVTFFRQSYANVFANWGLGERPMIRQWYHYSFATARYNSDTGPICRSCRLIIERSGRKGGRSRKHRWDPREVQVFMVKHPRFLHSHATSKRTFASVTSPECFVDLSGPSTVEGKRLSGHLICAQFDTICVKSTLSKHCSIVIMYGLRQLWNIWFVIFAKLGIFFPDVRLGFFTLSIKSLWRALQIQKFSPFWFDRTSFDIRGFWSLLQQDSQVWTCPEGSGRSNRAHLTTPSCFQETSFIGGNEFEEHLRTPDSTRKAWFDRNSKFARPSIWRQLFLQEKVDFKRKLRNSRPNIWRQFEDLSVLWRLWYPTRLFKIFHTHL